MSRVPSFVQIVQPNYKWDEGYSDKNVTRTVIPDDPDKAATLVIPGEVKTATDRLLRIRELVRARFAPETMAFAKKAIETQAFSSASIETAQNVRVALKARELGLLDDHKDTSLSKSFMQESIRETFHSSSRGRMSAEQKVLLAMSVHGFPLEGNPKDVDRWLDSLFGNLKLSNPTHPFLLNPSPQVKALLAQWRRQVDEAGTISDPVSQLAAIATATEEVLQAINPPPQQQPQPGDGDGEGGEGDNDGGESGESKGQGESGKSKDQKGKPSKSKSGGKDGDADNDGDPKPSDGKPEKSNWEDKWDKWKDWDKALARMPKVKRILADKVKWIGDDSRWDEYVESRIKLTKTQKEREKENKAPKAGDVTRVGTVTVSAAKDRRQLRDDDEIHLVMKATPEAWGEMEIVMAPLLRHFRAKARVNGTASPDGSHPKHWARWYLDRSVWDRKGKRPGGTLLIDISGSMSWAQNITKQLIEATPAMTIAVYGQTGDNGYGRLTVIARHGRLVSDSYPYRHGYNGGNGVDGPALEWLAQQPEPRVWFSDGQVVGRQAQAVNLFEEAARLCRLGNIHRALTVDNVKKIIAGQPFTKLPSTPNID